MSENTAALRHAIGVYRDAIVHRPHTQSKSFHLTVANDAEHTLARCAGAVPPKEAPTAHCQPTVERAMQEVYREIAVLCMSDARTLLSARRKAAHLLGIPHGRYVEVVGNRAWLRLR